MIIDLETYQEKRREPMRPSDVLAKLGDLDEMGSMPVHLVRHAAKPAARPARQKYTHHRETLSLKIA